MAATILGVRRRTASVPTPLRPWSSLGMRLNTWSPSNVAHLGSALGVDRAVALVVAAPWLNDRAHEATIEECRLAPGVVGPDAARELLGLIARDGRPPADVDTHRRAFNLALRFRIHGVPADPRLLESWIAVVGWGTVVVRPYGKVPTARWCAELHRSLVAYTDRLHAEHDSLDPSQTERFREWVRRAAPLGPDPLGTLLAHRPWRAGQAWPTDVAASALAIPGVVERATRWLQDLGPHVRAAQPDAGDGMPASVDALLLPYAALALADVEAREAVLSMGTRLARAGALRWDTLVHLLDALAHRVEWWRHKAVSAQTPALWEGPVAELLARTHGREAVAIDTTAIEAAEFVMTWCDHGFAVSERLLTMLTSTDGVELRGLIQQSDDDTRELALRISNGDLTRLRNTFVLGLQPRRHAWPLLPAWSLLDRHADLQAGMRSCFDRTELAARATRMLDRLALARRLNPGSALRRRLAALERATAEVDAPPFLQPDVLTTLGRTAGLSIEAGLAEPIPRPLRRILDSPAAMAGELRALRQRAKGQAPTDRQRARLAALERLQGDPAAVRDQVGRQLAKALPKQLALTTLAALETVAGAEIGAHWGRVLAVSTSEMPETANWDNALDMVTSVHHNSRALRELLRHEVRGDRSWIRRLPANQACMKAMADRGLNAEAWLAARSLQLPTPSGPLVVYAADDPLEILQMGNLFGTCLSADGCNAHAAIAAAVEVNKRVLYLRDAHGRVHGRRLLALTSNGEVLGFHSYGSGETAEPHAEPARAATGHERAALPEVRSWVKLAFDLMSLDLARATSARLRHQEADDVSAAYLTHEEERSLELFCEGYFDRIEAFDWWIVGLSRAARHTRATDRAQVARWVGTLPRQDFPSCGRRPSETCRALLWLGKQAPPLTLERATELGLGRTELSLLARHAPSARLRREAAELARAPELPAGP
jgi:hypothetical protein